VLNLLRRWGHKESPEAAIKSATDSQGNILCGVQTPEELLSDINRSALVRRLKTLVALHPDQFDTYYLETIKRFAALAQLFPASEYHHHSNLGGLLNHSLDLAVRAVIIRASKILPVNATPDIVARQIDHWTFAVFCMALWHDAGKISSDLTISRYTQGKKRIDTWNPWITELASSNCTYYRIEFNPNRQYRHHPTQSMCLMTRHMSVPALRWLSTDEHIFQSTLDAISSDNSNNPLHDILVRADQKSVVSNMESSSEPQIPSARQKPLKERVVTGLQNIIHQGTLALNRPGSQIYVLKNEVWFVSKKIVDALRNELDENGPSMPADNSRLMDELQGTGLFELNGDKLIWKATVTTPTKEGWSVTLTMLRMRIEKLWPNGVTTGLFPGSVLAEGETLTEITDSANNEGPNETALSVDQPEKNPPAQENKPPLIEPRQPIEVREEKSPYAEKEKASDLAPEIKSLALPLADNGGKKDKKSPQIPQPEAFIAWLREGIQTATLPLNTAKSMVHSVPNGLFLMSPAIFKRYAEAHGQSWNFVQRRFLQKIKHVQPNAKTHVVKYTVTGKRGNKQMTGVVVTEAKNELGINSPAPNVHLIQAEG